MQKIFIVALYFRKQFETPVTNNHFISEVSEALALDSALKSDESIALIKKGYSVLQTAVSPLNEYACIQNIETTFAHTTKLDKKTNIGVYINLQVPQTPELLEDLAALMQKHYQYTLPTTN